MDNGLRITRRTGSAKNPEPGNKGIGMCIIFTHSEAGGHPTNEDAFEVQRHPDECPAGSARSRTARGASPVPPRPHGWHVGS